MAGRAYGYRGEVRARPSGPVAAPSASRPLRWLGRLGVAVLAALVSVLGVAGVAAADPEENHERSLMEALQAAATGYYEAQAVLTASQQRYAEVQQNLQISQAALAQITEEIGKVAAARYQGSSVGLFTGMISGQADTETLLGGAAVGEYLLRRDDSLIREYRQLKEESERQQQLLDAELVIQQNQVALLDQQTREAERALAAVGGMVTSGFVAQTEPAMPAPRNADGTFPWENCSDDDPTSGGCLTPRTYHMLLMSQAAGFTRYTACWRSGTWGEHPAGRACDFSAFQSGFPSQAATGDDKAYGDQLAAWAVANAQALGVMYVIWYRQFWSPSTGWRGYSGYGSPADEHTNHVHISML